MSYKILEQNGIDNENVDGGAFNNFAAGGRDGIVGGVLSECALAAAGSTVSISPGLIMLHGIRVKVTGIETLSLSSVPIKPMSYQVVAQVTLASNGDVDFSIFIRTPQPLVQDPLYQNNVGVYQAELASFTHNSDGTISNLTKTLDIIYGSGGGSVNIEVGTVTTETLDAGLDADFDVNIRNEEGTNKILLDFDAKIPRGASGTDDQAVHFTPQGLSNSQKSQARENIGAASVAEMNAGDDKSYYNLGAFDTYVDNGDGTVTVTRKTRYISTKELCGLTWHLNKDNAYPVFYTDGSSSYSISNSVSNSDTLSFTQNVWGVTNSFCTRCYQDGSVRVDISLSANEASWSVENLLSWIVQNNLYIQAEVGTSEQYTKNLIAETPINTLDQNMTEIVRDEVEKTLNLCEKLTVTYDFGGNHKTVNIGTFPAGTYYLQATGGNSAFLYLGETYYDGNPQPDGLITRGFSFTLTETTVLNIDWYGYDLSGTSYTVMLNEGSHAYPYIPYSGQIVHQGDPDMEFATSEWEKTLNFCQVKDPATGSRIYIGTVSAGTYSICLNESPANNIGYQFQLFPNISTQTPIFTANVISTKTTFTVTETTDLYLYANGKVGTFSVMLNAGSNIYPYQPYNGAIVHEKRLSDALKDYLPLTGGTINGTINATGQVQEAGQRVYSPNNPPPGISPQIYSIPITFVNIYASLIFGYTGRTYAHSIACRMPDGFVIPTDFIIGLETGDRNVSVPVCNFYTDNGAIFCGLVTYVTNARSVPSVPISANKEYKIICVKNPMT